LRADRKRCGQLVHGRLAVGETPKNRPTRGIGEGSKGAAQFNMGRIVVTEFISLDGVMEAPGGGEGFKHDGWSFQFDRGPEGDKFKLDEALHSEALLLGRVTYEGFAKAWPSVEDDVGFADKFNGMPKYVVSSTLKDPEWNNSRVLDGDVVEEVTKLKDALSGDIVVHGSARLAQTLLEHDLADELRLMIFPVVLGSGKRLFGELTDKKRLVLAESRIVGDGISINVYERASNSSAVG
jgi:dihydrofolate reductase